MSQPARRRVHAIDKELRALCDIRSSALAELVEVRRRQSELLDMEATLVVSIAVRSRRIDDLLDVRPGVGPGRSNTGQDRDRVAPGGLLSGEPTAYPGRSSCAP